MRRFLTLVCLIVLAVPAGITISGCTRNPDANYCNGLGYGPKITDLYTITLTPQFTGVSLAYGQTKQSAAPTGANCKGGSVSVSAWTYGTTNNQLVDISPTGNMCAGTWNRNSGGGIADYTICSAPNPLPSTGGLPYGVAYITAAADSITSNPVPVYIHQAVTSVSLATSSTTGSTTTSNQCYSQGTSAQLDAQACFVQNGTQYLMCAPASVSSGAVAPACALPSGVSLASIPDCSNAIGTLAYTAGTTSVANINAVTNQITANLPGTTVITASIAGSGSSAGYFSTCPPASIALTYNGSDTGGVVTQGVTQNLVTTIKDTLGTTITGLTLDYQSTNPLDLTVSSAGAITAAFPGAASVYAVCQPATCNPAPINQIGVYGTGLSIASNAIDLTVPGSASAYYWVGAPGQSQYFVPFDLLNGTPGSTVRLPYVPNSMVMDQTGTNLYFGSQTELMVYTASGNTLSGAYTGLPGVVLAVAPNNSEVLVNDQKRQVFYLATPAGAIQATFGGMGVSAKWTPDAKTLYIVDSSAANVGGVTGHTDTLYAYNVNTGFTSYPLSNTPAAVGQTLDNPIGASQSLAVTIPSVGAYLAGATTVAHTWCPTGTPTSYATMQFYPQGDSANADTSVLAATTDGAHILGAALGASGISLSDIDVTIPTDGQTSAVQGDSVTCPAESGGTLGALLLSNTVYQAAITANATAVDGIVTSPAAVTTGSAAAANSLSFVTYSGTTPNATLPYYSQVSGQATAAGTVGYVTLANASSITAPVAGAFTPDNTLFLVSTSGDNMIHYINTTTLKDTQQIAPGLPTCTPVSAGGTDAGCLAPAGGPSVVPATVVVVKPRNAA